MKSKIATLAIATLMLAAVPSKAQAPTYAQSNVPFVCNGASRYPVTSLAQFQCRGLYFNNHNIEFLMQGNNQILFSQTTPQLTGYGSLVVTGFTLPQPTVPVTPGTFSFNYVFTDASGAVHTGYSAGTWLDFEDWRGWFHPELLTNSITVQ